jgi:copper chaperone CopZ
LIPQKEFDMKTEIDIGQSSGPEVCCSPGQDTRRVENRDTVNAPSHAAAEITLSISSMSCGSCAAKVQTALQTIGGVVSARVVLADSTARVRYDPQHTNLAEMVAVLAAAGYKAEAAVTDSSPQRTSRPVGWLKATVLWGAAAAVAVIGFYLGLITLTSGWSAAVYQFNHNAGWIIALAAGLSLQVGLFTRIRAAMTGMPVKGAGKGIAASGGMSGVAMALCCSHYLATVLPAIGLPFLSGAVAGLAQYQMIFFIIGVISNILGIAYMLRLGVKNGLVRVSAAY